MKTQRTGGNFLKFVKVIFIVAMLGLATSLFPKAGSAADMSVGLSFGIPFPIVAVHPPLPPPPVIVAPAHAPVAFYPAYHHRPRYRHAYGYGPYYRYHEDHGYRDNGCRNVRYRHHHRVNDDD